MDIQAIKQKIKELQQVVDDADKLPETKDLDLSIGQEMHYVHRFADGRMKPSITSYKITGLPFVPSTLVYEITTGRYNGKSLFLPVIYLKEGLESKISLLDANILPNNYNEHICFNKLQDAEKCIRLWNAGVRN